MPKGGWVTHTQPPKTFFMLVQTVLFQQPFEQGRIVSRTMCNMVNIDLLADQTIHADILSCNHIAVSAVSQFLIPRDMAGQREHLHMRERI